eukprot:gnl/Hemi2/12708_TR4341_c0_g1_i1.p2 gnl/Hemi2/12708_TR4341_c0_g1~~gnl/Hemi2/12708_TR4341_c0_g1_i1.p2  ORF type:complete len:194 (-),score=65.34 gnl/Hemi2/12708_TR4341_c0_g1_i1:23-604(-)
MSLKDGSAAVELIAPADYSQQNISNNTTKALYDSGVQLQHVPNRGKEAADKQIIQLLLSCAKKPDTAELWLVSSDRDFSFLTQQIRKDHPQLHMVLVHAGPPPDIVDQFNAIKQWPPKVPAPVATPTSTVVPEAPKQPKPPKQPKAPQQSPTQEGPRPVRCLNCNREFPSKAKDTLHRRENNGACKGALRKYL